MAEALHLPQPHFRGAVEPYAPRLGVTQCNPTPKPGPVMFRRFVRDTLGGGDLGIGRACNVGKPSDHHEGRAWDWGVDASNPDDVQRVNTMFAWLLAPENGIPHAIFRRAGLRYVIWDGKIWSSVTKHWKPYTGRSPHRDHVHFSFSWPGAHAKTSFYDWLREGRPVGPTPPGPLVPLQAASAWPFILGAAGGAAAVWLLTRKKK